MSKRMIELELIGIMFVGTVLLLGYLWSHLEIRQYRAFTMEKWNILVPADAQQQNNLFLTKLNADWKETELHAGDIATVSVGNTPIAEIDVDQNEIRIDNVSQWGIARVTIDAAENAGSVLVLVLRGKNQGDLITISFLLLTDHVYISAEEFCK